MPTDTPSRTLGITVLGDFILSEGVEPIIANLKRVGATAVACNPTVTAPADEGTGTFQPPADAGSSPRVFDRTLFGKQALWVRGGPSYTPNPVFYNDSPYAARRTNDLTEQHGSLIAKFLDAAVNAGLKVYFQVGSVQPSGLRDEDRPCLPDGTVADFRMADTGSLASPAIRAYNRAYAHDLIAAYPQIDGFRIDWPEYPCYTMNEVFHDFSPHVKSWADENGFDFDTIRDSVRKLYDHLSSRLSTGEVTSSAATIAAEFENALNGGPGIIDWLRLKTALSTDLIRDWRDILDSSGQSDLELTSHAFMPPYTTLTGLDLVRAGELSDCVSPKFYTMHWPLIVHFWTDWLTQHNPELDRTEVVRSLARIMQLGTDNEIDERIDLYRYPEPDEPHPIPVAAQQQKLNFIRHKLRDSKASLVPLVHGYGPVDDFADRFRIVAESEVDGVWINRYGYLSDEKLNGIRAAWDSANER